MLEQVEVPNPKTEDGGLLLPLKAMDSVLPTFCDGWNVRPMTIFGSLKKMRYVVVAVVCFLPLQRSRSAHFPRYRSEQGASAVKRARPVPTP